MTVREKFLDTMEFDLSTSPPFWEMGYWGITINRWYKEGMLEFKGNIPKDRLPGKGVQGTPVVGPLSGQGENYTESDTMINLDEKSKPFPGNFWIFPEFERRVLEKQENREIIIDEMGIKQKISSEGSIPEFYEWPVKNREHWEKFKDERLNPKTSGRYPKNLDEVIEKFKTRDYPLHLGGWIGFFGSLRYLMGEVRLMTGYYDDPGLIKDIINYLVDFWMELWSPILSRIEIDWVCMWEDMCYKTGPLVSPDTFREFMLPAYKKFTSFLKNYGVRNIIMDTDGNCWKLIPLFLEGGITGLLPMEVAAGMNIIEVRKEFPKLQIMGGIDKRALIKGKKAIDRELESKVPLMLKKGGYIPHADHLIPPDVSLKNFLYYRSRLNKIINELFKS